MNCKNLAFCVFFLEPETEVKYVVEKKETQEAPAPKKDRIIGGIGGGGFISGKEKGRSGST